MVIPRQRSASAAGTNCPDNERRHFSIIDQISAPARIAARYNESIAECAFSDVGPGACTADYEPTLRDESLLDSSWPPVEPFAVKGTRSILSAPEVHDSIRELQRCTHRRKQSHTSIGFKFRIGKTFSTSSHHESYFGFGTGGAGSVVIRSPGPGVVNLFTLLFSPSLSPPLSMEVTV